MEQTPFALQLTDQTPSFLIPLLQGDEIPVLPAAEHRGVPPPVGVERPARVVERGQLVEEDEIVREPDVHAVFGWGAVLVEPAEERRPRGAAVTGEIQQKVRMGGHVDG